jgi:O-antigen ligase
MRFQSSSTSGRELIWNIVETWVARYPHTGIGFGHCGAVIPWHVSRFTGTEATHNEYLRLALELGYWGTICFMVGFLAVCMTAIKRFSFEALVLFGAFFLYAYTDNVFFLTYALLGPLACIHGVLLTRQDEPEVDPGRKWAP